MTGTDRNLNQYLFATWNIRGMGTPQKRYKTLAQFKRRNIQIAFLQETHLLKKESSKLRRKWRGQFYCTYYSTFARGAAVWLRAGVPFVADKERIDIGGRYALIRGRLDGRQIVLGSLYFPNID